MTPDLLKCCNTEGSQYCFGNTTNFITFFGPSWSKESKPYWLTLRTLGYYGASITCELEDRHKAKWAKWGMENLKDRYKERQEEDGKWNVTRVMVSKHA